MDAQLPQRPTIDLVNSYDTGSSNQDNITDLTTLVFRVSAEPGSLVNIKDGEVVIASFTFDNAFDLTDGVVDGYGLVTINFVANQGTFNIPSEGRTR